MTCENVTIQGDKGTPITAYVAKPSGPGPFPGVVLVHHLPGWSEFYIETTRRFAHHGYLAICANLYERAGQGNPDDVAAKVRADGGISDAQMVGDTEAAVKWMRAQSNHNGKVGIFGSCSGGRHAFIYACQRKDVDACAELWGGRVVMGKEELNAKPHWLIARQLETNSLQLIRRTYPQAQPQSAKLLSWRAANHPATLADPPIDHSAGTLWGEDRASDAMA
jgi:carboxymethylenebutenolidase